jgi:hypothetical protein
MNVASASDAAMTSGALNDIRTTAGARDHDNREAAIHQTVTPRAVAEAGVLPQSIVAARRSVWKRWWSSFT